MARYGMDPNPTWGVDKLLDSGVPAGPLAEPQHFWRRPAGGKYHAKKCTRVRLDLNPVLVNFLTEPVSAYCTTCVDGPTSPDAAAYVEHARLVQDARRQLEVLRHELVEYRDGCTVDPHADTAQMALVRTIGAPIVIDEPTWEQVNRAEAIVRMLTAVREARTVHTVMLDWMAPVDQAARALHAHLKAGAVSHTDDAQLLRLCVLDLMGNYSTYNRGSDDHRDTPAGAQAPTIEHATFPAVCTTGSDYSHRTDSEGFEGLLNEAWQTWRAEVGQTNDFTAARSAVLRATRIPTLEPKYVPQLHHGAPRTPAQPTLWQQEVAEWRFQALAELDMIVTLWQEQYSDQLQEALTAPDQVVALERWELHDRRESNASTRVLAQLHVVLHSSQETALLVAPDVVARWLTKFDVHGSVRRAGSSGQRRVRVIGNSLPGDDDTYLSTALRLWEPRIRAGKMTDLAQAVRTAEGIHAA